MSNPEIIEVEQLKEPKDFYHFLDNEPSLEEAACYEGNRKYTLAKSLLISAIEIRTKALDQAEKIKEIDENNADLWWDITETLEEEIGQAISNLNGVQYYLDKGFEEMSPEEEDKERQKIASKQIRKLRIEYLKYISVTVVLTLLFCIKAYIKNPWLVILPILVGAIIIFIQTIMCSVRIVHEIPYIEKDKNERG